MSEAREITAEQLEKAAALLLFNMRNGDQLSEVASDVKSRYLGIARDMFAIANITVACDPYKPLREAIDEKLADFFAHGRADTKKLSNDILAAIKPLIERNP